MVQVLKRDYWSRADAFLLPLTGLNKNETYEMRSYLFWNEYTIDDYKLMVTFSYDDEYDKFVNYCRNYIFPVLDRKGYLVENYDILGRSIFILDMSEWAMDIQMFMSARYSKFSLEAKNAIEKYHTFNGNQIDISVYSVLYPNKKISLLGEKTPIEYVAENYDLNLADLKSIGEIGSVYDEMSETLLTDINEICQSDT